jgi:toxin ParE1/3/4
MKVRLTKEARGKLDDVLDAILSVNPFAARRYRDKIGSSLRRLGRYPRLGHVVPEYPTAQVKQFIVLPYRFFYFIDERERTVWVVDVWHGAQLPAEPRLPAGREPEPARE